MASLSSTWQDIRALRAKQINLAAKDPDRGNTFAAALRQSEELAFSATAAGYATKALPLFYSLNQAGRAIAAARLSSQTWNQFRGHGVSVGPDAGLPLLKTVIKPAKQDGLFQRVTEAMNSNPLMGPTELGALWAGNPDLLSIPIPETAGRWPKALEIEIGPEGGMPGMPIDPEAMVETAELVPMSVHLDGHTGQEVVDQLQSYPTLRDAFPVNSDSSGYFAVDPSDVVERSAIGHVTIAKRVPAQIPNKEQWKARRGFASILHEEWMPGFQSPKLTGHALPEIGSAPSPEPLMLWWMLLIGLSSLTRYHPALWTKEIDPDDSELAVSLEKVLDTAGERVPTLVLDALKAP